MEVPRLLAQPLPRQVCLQGNAPSPRRLQQPCQITLGTDNGPRLFRSPASLNFLLEVLDGLEITVSKLSKTGRVCGVPAPRPGPAPQYLEPGGRAPARQRPAGHSCRSNTDMSHFRPSRSSASLVALSRRPYPAFYCGGVQPRFPSYDFLALRENMGPAAPYLYSTPAV